MITPINLISWGHIAQISRVVAPSGKDWRFSKADRASDYNQLPLERSHPHLAAIDLRCPKDKRWYGFISRAMVFGAIAAVLRYIVFSRIVAEIASKILGIPLCDDSMILERLSQVLWAENLWGFSRDSARY